MVASNATIPKTAVGALRLHLNRAKIFSPYLVLWFIVPLISPTGTCLTFWLLRLQSKQREPKEVAVES